MRPKSVSSEIRLPFRWYMPLRILCTSDTSFHDRTSPTRNRTTRFAFTAGLVSSGRSPITSVVRINPLTLKQKRRGPEASPSVFCALGLPHHRPLGRHVADESEL